jgi:hypothetical protein
VDFLDSLDCDRIQKIHIQTNFAKLTSSAIVLLETSDIFFRLKKRGAERDDFDFLIFFLQKKGMFH